MTDTPKPRLPNSLGARPKRRSEEQANAATFAALFGLGLLAFGLIAMVGMILPQVRGLILVFFGGVGFFVAHYVLWGWWLPKLMKPHDDTE